MLLPKETPKRVEKQKKYSPLIRKYIHQTGSNAKYALVGIVCLVIYLVVGASVFFFLEDCSQDVVVNNKDVMKSWDQVLETYCRNESNESSIEKIRTVLFSVSKNCSNIFSSKPQNALGNKSCDGGGRIEKWIMFTFATVHALGKNEPFKSLVALFYPFTGQQQFDTQENYKIIEKQSL